MSQPINDDAFVSYVATRLLPFLKKYKVLFVAVGIGLALGIIIIGTLSSKAEAERKTALNDIYTAIDNAKEVDVALLEGLDSQYGDIPIAIEVKWRLAAEYTKAGDLVKAADVYRNIIEEYGDLPVAVQARLALGSCLEDSGDYSGALQIYADGARLYRSRKRIALYFQYRTAAVHLYMQDFAQSAGIIASTLDQIDDLPLDEQSSSFDDTLRSNLENIQNYLKAQKK